MKQLIELIRLGTLTAFSVALYSAHRRTQATQTGSNDPSIKPDRQSGSEGELVLLGIDGTVIAREVNLSQHGPLRTAQQPCFLNPVRTNSLRSA